MTQTLPTCSEDLLTCDLVMVKDTSNTGGGIVYETRHHGDVATVTESEFHEILVGDAVEINFAGARLYVSGEEHDAL